MDGVTFSCNNDYFVYSLAMQRQAKASWKEGVTVI